MPYASIPPSELVTDQTLAFTSARLTTLRDNLETFHDHTTGKGRPLHGFSFTPGTLVDAQFADGSITSRKWKLSHFRSIVTSAAADLPITADGASYYDTNIKIDQNFQESGTTRIEGFYTYRLVDPVLAVQWEIVVERNGTQQAKMRHNSAFGYGGTIHWISSTLSGNETFEVFWRSTTSPGGSPTMVRAPRQMLVFAYGVT